MNRVRLRAFALCAALFMGGALCGGLAMQLYVSHRMLTALEKSPEQAHTDAVIWGLDHTVGLSAEQKQRIRSRLQARETEARALTRSMEPAFTELRNRYRADIRAELRPDQQRAFDALVQKLDARRRRAGD